MSHPRRALGVTLVCAFLMVPPCIADSDSGAISVLVKSRKALTPEVTASIAASGAKPSYIWPEIGALVMKLPPSSRSW